MFEVRINGISGDNYKFEEINDAHYFVVNKCKELNIPWRSSPPYNWDGHSLTILNYTFEIRKIDNIKYQKSFYQILKFEEAKEILIRYNKEGFIVNHVVIQYPDRIGCWFIKNSVGEEIR
jgi:hypothetical protein